MSVEEVYQFLKEKRGWWMSKDISKEIKIMNEHNVSKALRRLRESYPESINWRYRDKKNSTSVEYKAR